MSQPERWLVWGARGHALVLADLAALTAAQVVLLADNDPHVVSPLPGVEVVPGLAGIADALRARPKREQPSAFAIAIGGGRGADRLIIHQQLVGLGLRPAVLVHPAAHVSASAFVGPGAQVLAGAVVGAAASVGSQCIVNTSATVDHECALGAGSHVGPGATLAGCVEVGEAAFVGAGATVLPYVRIGAGATVGAGAVVTTDVGPHVTVVGVPARPR